MADATPASRLAALRAAVEASAPHEIKKVGALLRQGAQILRDERSDALTEGWCRWLIRDAGPAWRRALDESDASDAIDAVVDAGGAECLVAAVPGAAWPHLVNHRALQPSHVHMHDTEGFHA